METDKNANHDESDLPNESSSDESIDSDLHNKPYKQDRNQSDTSYGESSSSECSLKKNTVMYKTVPRHRSLRILHASIFSNILSYNIDCSEHDIFRSETNNFKPMEIETPVSILMKENETKNDIYLSSDDEEFVEGDGKNKLIPVKDFVLKSWIIP